MSGERALIFSLLNRSAKKCQLVGFPGLALYDSSAKALAVCNNTAEGPISPFVTRAQPRVVVLKPGAMAFFKVAKYACTSGATRRA